MTFLNSGLAAQDRMFRVRIQACLYKLAGDVLNADASEPDHEVRVKLADSIASQFGTPVDELAWLCASNPSIAASVTTDANGVVTVGALDSDIEFVCASNFTRIAQRRFA